MAGTRIAVGTWLAVLACGASSSGQAGAPATPVVGVVLTDGKLLPLATVKPGGGDWQLLPWPRHAAQEPQAGPAVPPTASAIPKEWFAPLPALPSTWRMQAINGARTSIHAAAPTRWQVATFDAIGLLT